MDNITFKLKKLSNNKYKVIVKVPFSIGWIDKINIILNNNSYQLNHTGNDNNYAYFEKDMDFGIVNHFYFNYTVNGKSYDYKNENNTTFKFSTYKNPDWAKGKVMYQIFIDSFYRDESVPVSKMKRREIVEDFYKDRVLGPNPRADNLWNVDYHCGNIKGIIDKLDYIASLGVSILYLSSIFYAQSTHGYDSTDYLKGDPYHGSYEDLKELCREAHKRGIKVIVDVAFNHTGSDSVYFDYYNEYGNGAFNNPDSPYNAYYNIWNRDSNGRGTFDSEGKPNYETWWGFYNLPKAFGLEWEEFITGEGGVIDKLFECGIDGLRIDVTDELEERFLRKMINAVHRNKEDGFFVHEIWDPYVDKKPFYIDIIDSQMNYFLHEGLIKYNKYGDVGDLQYKLHKILHDYPDEVIQCLMNPTSTHDISRLIDIYGYDGFVPIDWIWDLDNNNYEFLRNFKLSDEQRKKGIDLEMVHLFELCFLPGILSILYGDEVGLEGLGNLLTRNPFPWNNMNYDLLKYYQYIGSIRKNEPFLEKASIRIRDINPTYFQFERYDELNKMLITVNRTNVGTRFLVPPEYNDPEKVYTLKKSKPGYLDAYGGVAIKKSMI